MTPPKPPAPEMVTRFRKKPVVIEAWQWDGAAQRLCDRHYFDAVPDWLKESEVYYGALKPGQVQLSADIDGGSARIEICTLEGQIYASPGDWIIKGVKGELYPCKPDIFAATYEPADAALLQSQPAAQEGWKLVPREPTREMVEAGRSAIVGWAQPANVSCAREVHQAMYDAAPPAQEPSQHE